MSQIRDWGPIRTRLPSFLERSMADQANQLVMLTEENVYIQEEDLNLDSPDTSAADSEDSIESSADDE